jgi:hypothetical protein
MIMIIMKGFRTFILILLLVQSMPAIIPQFYGARSLALGYASIGHTYGFNSVFINPSLLGATQDNLGGYQYHASYLDYKDFLPRLNSVLAYGLSNYENLSQTEQQEVFSQLEDLYSFTNGLNGFTMNGPGFTTGRYAVAVSFVNSAVLNPRSSSIFDKGWDGITNKDIASLEMEFIGVKYKKISVGYGVPLTNNVGIGVTIHYLNGKISGFRSNLQDDIFNVSRSSKGYLSEVWDREEKSFSKIISDLGLYMNVSSYFRVGLIARNLGSPTVTGPGIKVTFRSRISVGMSFRPDPQFGIYFDMDVKKTDLFHSGKDSQPFSVGVEKGFFNGRFFLRAGFLNDLSEKYFFGNKANILYGLGAGFNMKNLIIDVGMGLDSDGSVDNIAISGFYLLR